MEGVGNPARAFPWNGEESEKGNRQAVMKRRRLKQNKGQRTKKLLNTDVIYREILLISIIECFHVVAIPFLYSDSLVGFSMYTADPHYLWISYFQIHLLTKM